MNVERISIRFNFVSPSTEDAPGVAYVNLIHRIWFVKRRPLRYDDSTGNPDRLRRSSVKSLLVVALFLFGAMSVVGQTAEKPTVAVLDAFLDEGIDSSAGLPVTEKIIEALVASNRYTVLDRGSVRQVLEEKKFQLSGLVADSEIKQAGVYLGAAYVCVAKVSRVGRTYFVSGKIIDVETGEIVAQNSQEGRGEIDVVIELARSIGRALSGEAVGPKPADDEPKAPERVEGAAGAENGKRADEGSPHIIVSYLMPGFVGSGAAVVDRVIDEYIVNYGGAAGGYATRGSGLAVHFLQPLFGVAYASVSAGYLTRSDRSDYFYSFADDVNRFQRNFSLFGVTAGAGAVFRALPILQAYGGLGVGLLVMTLDDLFWGSSLRDSATSFSFEIGADLLPFDPVVINASLVFATANLTGLTVFSYEERIGYVALGLGAGISY